MSTPPFTPPNIEPKITEKELRKLLLSCKPEDAARLDQWRRDAAPEEVFKTHEAVAKGAGETPFSSLLTSLAPILPLLPNVISRRMGGKAPVWLELLFIFGGIALFLGNFAYMGWLALTGRRAVEWLIGQRQRQALKPMANFWRPFRRGKATEASNVAFQEFLSELPVPLDFAETAALRKMIERALSFRLRLSQRDFSDSAADVLLVALGCLAKSSTQYDSTLRRVAQFPAPASCPNRVLLRDMAILFVEKPKVVVPIQRPVNAHSATPLVTVAATTTETKNAVQQRVKIKICQVGRFCSRCCGPMNDPASIGSVLRTRPHGRRSTHHLHAIRVRRTLPILAGSFIGPQHREQKRPPCAKAGILHSKKAR